MQSHTINTALETVVTALQEIYEQGWNFYKNQQEGITAKRPKGQEVLKMVKQDLSLCSLAPIWQSSACGSDTVDVFMVNPFRKLIKIVK